MNHNITDSRGVKKSKQSPKSSKCMQSQQGQFCNFNSFSSFTTTTSTQPPSAAPPHVFQSSLHSPIPTPMSNPNPNSHPCIYISPTPMHFSFSNHLCHPMEEEDQEAADHQKVTTTPSSSSSSSSSRWNPTKEQISILEGLYKQGIRTPTAEQIQQITSRLKQYGCIEGKNVFYWFQNHKARQRQKQRQETFAYFTTLPPPPSPPPPPCNTAVYLRGHYQQQYHHHHHHHNQVGSIGFYQQPLHQCQNSMFASANVRMEMMKAAAINGFSVASDHHPHHQTLELFPLHPTGILEDNCASSNESLEDGDGEIGGENLTLFDFFSSQRLC